MKPLFLIFFLSLSTQSTAQILNAESLRKVTDTSGFSGAVSLDINLKRNTNSFFKLSNNIHIQYKTKEHLILFKNDIAFQKIEGENFENSGIQHLRYNHKLSPRLAWEVFTQAQYNKVSKIDFRGLLGAGPRLKLTKSDDYKFYFGSMLMYEQEELGDGITPIQRNLRASAYLSFSLYPTSNISITSTTYYQPKLKAFSDYRVSSQSSLVVGLFENFGLKTSYTFTYDAFPAIGIPNSQYDLTTGFSYTFD